MVKYRKHYQETERMGKIILINFLFLSLTTCGFIEDKDENSSQPPSNSNGLPADWDGTTDYAASTLQIEDIER